jgi:hypothetical protein
VAGRHTGAEARHGREPPVAAFHVEEELQPSSARESDIGGSGGRVHGGGG